MALNASAYQTMLLQLLPPGLAWTRDPSSTLAQLMLALADELAALDARVDDLLLEMDPRTTTELIGDWEAMCGLPDPCAGDVGDQSLAGRRTRIVAKLTELGGQSPAYLISVAAALGYTVTITEFLTDASDANRVSFRVNAPESTIDYMTCESACDDRLETWGNEVLECAINRVKPAHTTAIFAYGS
ncbi:MAG TPA: putative phage tail protein [Caulobacteraceae bacterium]|nr:putative phage tail protein [Caulobacteraceae bacterium]